MIRVPELSKDTWRALARFFEIVGAVAFLGLLISFMVLVAYYASHRPIGPQPDQGWTSPLRWGVYGTPDEAARLDWIVWSQCMSFGVIAVGLGIRIYKLGEDLSRMR